MINLSDINPDEKHIFLEMAAKYFKELNPSFHPERNWEEHYFAKLYSNPDLFLKWIVKKDIPIGFAIYGLVNHLYLDKKIGNIHEFYITSTERCQGNGKSAAHLLIKELKEYHPTNIQLEVVEGNKKAKQFWQSIGFCPFTQKYVFAK